MRATILRTLTLCLLLGGGALVESTVPAAAQSRCGAAVTVRSGETLQRIASRCGVSVAAILRLTPRITDPNRILVGQLIRLGGEAVVDVGAPSPGTYRVRAGDTLASIARRYGISLSALRAANRLLNPNRIRIGIAITIPD